jgi:hypothetical protein
VTAVPDLPEVAPVTSAANSLLQAGVLGALVVILLAFSFYTVWKWNKANEARVKDQKEMAHTLVELTTGFKEALMELNGTVDALKTAVQANTAASEKMERTLNETVRDAVRAVGAGARRFSPPGGTPAMGGKAPGGE